jgi:hypothetical protein
VILHARWERILEQMISDGCSEEDALASLDRQRAIDLAWKEALLPGLPDHAIAAFRSRG